MWRLRRTLAIADVAFPDSGGDRDDRRAECDAGGDADVDRSGEPGRVRRADAAANPAASYR